MASSLLRQSLCTIVSLVVIASLFPTVDAWSPPKPNSPLSCLEASGKMSRKTFVVSASMVVGSMMLGHNSVALAAEEQAMLDLSTSPSLRNVKRAQKQLLKLEASLAFEDYAVLKESLRTSPFGEIRKNASTLVKAYGGVETPEGRELKDLYDKFIVAVERLDSLTGQALRGKKDLQEDIAAAYQRTCSALDTFLAVVDPPSTDASPAETASTTSS